MLKCNLRYLTYDDLEMMEVNVLNIYGKLHHDNRFNNPDFLRIQWTL